MKNDLRENFVSEIKKEFREWESNFLDVNFLGLRNSTREQKSFGTKIDSELVELYLKVIKVQGKTTKSDLSLHMQNTIQNFINDTSKSETGEFINE